ncbi:PilZ domain-containing protein [Sphingosinicella sp.]|uniref:PilZ domain-containing protein n=1 Tax=Sphingosinicella sp. TaxID=1917971 RepID=UPI0040378250
MARAQLIDDEMEIQPDAEAEPDRRADHRFRTVYRTAKVGCAGELALWRVRNISDRGIMLEVDRPIDPGERLEIALSETMLIEARVVWAANGRCGAVFREPIDCPMLLQELAAERRKLGYRAPRLPVIAQATASNEHGAAKVELFNLSQYGVGFAHDGRFHPGMAVKLKVAGAPERRGVVRWSRDGRAGLFLTEPFSCTDLHSIASGRAMAAEERRSQESGILLRNDVSA